MTLDLGGFTISPPQGTFVTAYGVYAHNGNDETHGVLTKNGSITDFRSILGISRGVSIEGSADAVENLNVLRNDDGVLFDGGLNSATHVRASSSGGRGFLCFGGGVSVRDSVAFNNGGNGIDLLACSGNSVVGNTAGQNGGTGITVACPSLVIENTASQNGAGDIVTDPSASCTQANNNPAP
ncbi:MAG TPA: right-handed parallel beta-helix repeat-containing protein [Vicinamibacteria bacterium]|nr:right-handed parallel beta-helix repeat-containing protein [Vicinamibacteria bacterium]